MKHLLAVFLLVATGPGAFGNAKVTVGAVLEMEQIEAVIQGKTAKVAGMFRFRKFSTPAKLTENGAKVFFPLVSPKGVRLTLADARFELRFNGQAATSYSITTNPPVAVPASDDYSIVWIVAQVPVTLVNRWNIKVAYQQELVDGVFYYLPILDNVRPNPELQIRVTSDRPIHPVGKSAGGLMAKGSRELIFVPSHLGMIGVSANPVSSNKDDNSKPAAGQ